jgi:hypothetical protein
MIELVLVLSFLNLGLNIFACWQRHATLRVHKQNGGGE